MEASTIDYFLKLIDISWWFYAVAIILGLIGWKIWRLEGGLLIGYVFLVIVETLIIREVHGGAHFQLDLFWSWKSWDNQKRQILVNVIMFFPVGILSGCLWKWRGLFFAVGLSVTIEVLQLVTKRGLFEYDDIVHNTLGALVGVSFFLLVKMSIKKRRSGS